MAEKQSASQTAGPYVHVGCVPTFAGLEMGRPDLGAVMLSDAVAGERITFEGRVIDGDGAPVTDVMLELWQADAAGRFDNPDFQGWGRAPGDATDASFRFETIKPGQVAWPSGGLQAPHLALWIVARGINLGLHTRVYFSDEQEANDRDPVLSRVPAERRSTMIAVANGTRYQLDVHLQGDREMVFLDV